MRDGAIRRPPNGVGGHGLGDTGVSGVWGGDGGARQATVIRARGCA